MKQPFVYYGGKQLLKNEILRLIPKHDIYVETCLGGGTIFWNKERSKVEVINDLNDLIVIFYRVCVLDFDRLKVMIDSTMRSRYSYNLAYKILNNKNEYSELEIAWSVFVAFNLSFGAKLGGGYGFSRMTSKSNSNTFFNKKINFSIEHKNRLDRVEIECIDMLHLITNRDSDETFFYVDPPYFNSDCGHYKGYLENDFEKLLIKLTKIKGKFLLSSYPSEILEKFKIENNWNQKKIEKNMCINAKNGDSRKKPKIEVLTYNYTI